MNHTNGCSHQTVAGCGTRNDRREHSAHLYTDSASLCEAIVDYIGPALDRGEAAIVIATPAHTVGCKARLERSARDADWMIHTGQLSLIDAEATLKSIMVGSGPDRQALEAAVVEPIRDRQRRFGKLCAYGEMVNLLWRQNNRQAAHQLEQWWNEMIDQFSFSLMCGYRTDMFDSRVESDLELICQTHARLSTLLDGDRFEQAFDRAMEAVIPTADTQAVRQDLVSRCRHRIEMPQALAALSALHDLLPTVAHEVRLKMQDCLQRSSAMALRPDMDQAPPRRETRASA